jgi:hypothetical protein
MKLSVLKDLVKRLEVNSPPGVDVDVLFYGLHNDDNETIDIAEATQNLHASMMMFGGTYLIPLE